MEQWVSTIILCGEGDFVTENYRTTIHIKARSFNILLNCGHAPKEEKSEASKDLFYELFGAPSRQDIKIVLVDFNTRVVKEGSFGTIVRKFSLRLDRQHTIP